LGILYDFLSLMNDVNVPSKKTKQKKILLMSCRSLMKRAGSGTGHEPDWGLDSETDDLAVVWLID
jgi:hypothetical protein